MTVFSDNRSKEMVPNANLNERTSVERLYPLSAFDQDAGENSSATSPQRRGVRIESVPDAAGAFRMVRSSQALTGPDTPGTAFVCPYMGRAYGLFMIKGGGRGAVEERGDIFADHLDEYTAFLDTLVQTAREMPAAPYLDPSRLADIG
jgi:hypothetical protein